jgi:hypothetical protein
MPDFIRVRDTSGHEISIRGDVADGHPRGIQEGQRRLDKPAVGADGLPLAPKYRTRLGTPLPGSKKARKQAQAAATPDPETTPADQPGENDGQSAAPQEGN